MPLAPKEDARRSPPKSVSPYPSRSGGARSEDGAAGEPNGSIVKTEAPAQPEQAQDDSQTVVVGKRRRGGGAAAVAEVLAVANEVADAAIEECEKTGKVEETLATMRSPRATRNGAD